MTDRELLELAAKAAGLDVVFVGTNVMSGPDDSFYLADDRWRRKPWNPLTDDGDALRLAVKLHMFLRCGHYAGVEHPVTVEADNGTSDVEAATRRAVVGAAAAVASGKDMLTHAEFVLMFPGSFPKEEVERARAKASQVAGSSATAIGKHTRERLIHDE